MHRTGLPTLKDNRNNSLLRLVEDSKALYCDRKLAVEVGKHVEISVIARHTYLAAATATTLVRKQLRVSLPPNPPPTNRQNKRTIYLQ